MMATGLTTGTAHAATCHLPAASCQLRENVLHQDKLGNVFRTDVYCDNRAGDVH
ncbi:hypothetical protein [Streptomyces caelestis]|uniref:hypothetical protein n=1 Tax=Streptomyces caelestis TaxID=36816 RepID=UPI0036F8BAC7